MIVIPKSRPWSWWLVLSVVAVLAVAACGGSSDERGVGNGKRPQESTGISAQQNQATGSGGSSSESAPLAAANPCNAFSMIGGAGAGGLISQAFGGPDVDTSRSPQSDFAEAVSKFSREALEQVFDGKVSADCFFEATMGDEGVVWIALILPSAPPSGAGQALGEAMTAMGATVEGSFSSTTAGGTFDLVGLGSLPFQAPGGVPSTGGLYFVTGEEGQSLAVMVASYESDGGSQVTSNGAGGQGSGMDAQPPIIAVAPTGIAATISDQLKPALEDALGVSLIVESFFQTAAAGTNSVSLSYVVDGGMPADADLIFGFTKAIEGLGGSVTFSMAGSGGANVGFDGLQIGGDSTLSGSIGLAENQIFVTLVTQ